MRCLGLHLIHPIYLQWIPWLFGHLFLWTWSRWKLVKELSEVQKCIWPDTCKQLLIYSVHNLTVAFTFVLIVIWTDRTDRLFFTSWKISWAIISWCKSFSQIGLSDFRVRVSTVGGLQAVSPGKLFDTDRSTPYSSGAIRTRFDFILGCSPRVNEESESRWIIRFCFIKLEEKPFHSFHSSSNRERRESEIMIDYLSKKYNYMLQNGGKYHCHNQYHLSCGFEDRRWVELHRGGQK